MEKTQTTNPVNYEAIIGSDDEVHFILHPEVGVHTQEDAFDAIEWLRANKSKTIGLRTEWLQGEIKIPETRKIPASFIIKNQEREIEELTSKIEFLENEKIKETTQQYKLIKANEVKKMLIQKQQVQKELLYLELKKELKDADKEIKNLRETISELLIKMYKKD